MTNLQVTGLIDANGDFDMIRNGTSGNPGDNAQFVGTATASGNSFPATNFQGFAPFGSEFQDGSTHGTGSVSGTLSSSPSVISATYTFTTDMDNSLPPPGTGTLSLTLQTTLTSSGSSLSAIGENFTDPNDANTYIDVSSTNGAITGQADAGSSNPGTCTLSGQASILNASYDVYGIQLTFSGCTGSYASMSSGSNATLSGLATLEPAAGSTPATLLVGVSGQSPGSTYNAFVFSVQE